MKHAFKFTLILAFMLITFSTYAQKHNLQPGWCKYAKNGKGTARDESASAQCKVCDAEREKEKKDKAIADKANSERLALKWKADKIAADAKHKEKMKKANEDNKSTEVFVTMPKTSAVAANPKKPVEKKPMVPGKMVYMTASSGDAAFRNAVTKEDLLLAAGLPYWAVEGTYMEDGTISRNNFPANYGVVQMKNSVTAPSHPFFEYASNAGSYKPYDLVNSQFKRVFNSDSISRIVHFYGNWFLVSYGFSKVDWFTHSFGAVKLYNVKTKESVPIPEKSYRQAVEMVAFKYHGLENEAIARNYRYFKGSYEGDGIDGKKARERSACEKTFDNIVGGPDKWKAFVAVKPFKSKQDINVEGYVYYCDVNEKIVKVRISDDDLRKIRG
ncbi:hypothetical protein [Pedobacter gandavensis]|uniref:hypothetical protein n=1 Tax=Pedobacter gandavensis TaxID=2679963 RepID=UPI002930E54B|nr:hypothetical protein [Pedobacter gandavensis]